MGERDAVPILPVDADLLSLSEEVRRVVEENRRFLERLFDETLHDDEPDTLDEGVGDGDDQETGVA